MRLRYSVCRTRLATAYILSTTHIIRTSCDYITSATARMSSTNQTHPNSHSTPSADRSRRTSSSGSLPERSPAIGTDPSTVQQARNTKPAARSSKIQKRSPVQRSMAKVVRASPALAQSPTFASTSRATSSPSDDSASAVRLTKTGRVSKALKGEPVHKCNICDKVSLLMAHLHLYAYNLTPTRFTHAMST